MESLTVDKFDGIMNLAIQYGTKIIGALVLILITFWIAAKLKNLTLRAMSRSNIDLTLAKFTGTMVRWLVLVAAGVAILGMFGVETTSFAAVIAASGLAIGLAFQGALSNIAAGVMLLIFRPFKIGQFIKVAGTSGTVCEISLFTTVLDTVDNRRIIVPNSNVFGSTIENVSEHETRRVDVEVGTAYDADLDKTRSVLNNVFSSVDGIIDNPAPVAVMTNLGASSVDWSLRAWCKSSDYWAVRENLLVNAKKALDEQKIGIPFPQMDVHFQGMALNNLSKNDKNTTAPLQ